MVTARAYVWRYCHVGRDWTFRTIVEARPPPPLDPTRPVAHGTATSASPGVRRHPLSHPAKDTCRGPPTGSRTARRGHAVWANGVKLRGTSLDSQITRAWHVSTSQLTLADGQPRGAASQRRTWGVSPMVEARPAKPAWIPPGPSPTAQPPAPHLEYGAIRRFPLRPMTPTEAHPRAPAQHDVATRFGPSASSCVARRWTRKSLARGTSPPAS